MSPSDSNASKIQTHFQALTKTASALNTASDELTKGITILDEALKKLNVGLTVWVTFISWVTDAPQEYDEEQIGYCKINGKWGIGLRRIWGDHIADKYTEDGPWAFHEGPREMRLRGVDKIPEVIEKLGEDASKMTTQVKEKTKQVRELAAAIEDLTKIPQKNALRERLASFDKDLIAKGFLGDSLVPEPEEDGSK
jgi:prefoldin subunit 5